jgi:hypothetical protein
MHYDLDKGWGFHLNSHQYKEYIAKNSEKMNKKSRYIKKIKDKSEFDENELHFVKIPHKVLSSFFHISLNNLKFLMYLSQFRFQGWR